jgi:hypothetical protein
VGLSSALQDVKEAKGHKDADKGTSSKRTTGIDKAIGSR